MRPWLRSRAPLEVPEVRSPGARERATNSEVPNPPADGCEGHAADEQRIAHDEGGAPGEGVVDEELTAQRLS
eukprot:5396332-Alexandrium_andersonii.AAC.1